MSSRITTVVGGKEVAIIVEGDTVAIHIEGYGINNAEPGEGCVVAVDLWPGDDEDEGGRAPHVYVWGSINREEYTDSVSLEGAAEWRRAN